MEVYAIIGQSNCEQLRHYPNETIKLLTTNDQPDFGMIKMIFSNDEIFIKNKRCQLKCKIIMETNDTEKMASAIKRRAKIITFTHKF